MGNCIENCFKSSKENSPREENHENSSPEENHLLQKSTSREENPLVKEKQPIKEETPSEEKRAEPETALSSTELPENVRECIALFKEIEDTGNIDELINMIQQLHQRIKIKKHNDPENATTRSPISEEREKQSGIWTSITNKGFQFLESLNKFGSSEKLHQGIKVATKALPQVGQINMIVAGLSTIAFVLSKYEETRDNQPKCLEVLGDLIVLAQHLQSLKKLIPEEKEKITKAIQLIVEGSIICLRQSNDKQLFRFIKSSVNSQNLMSLRKRINDLYPNLVLTSINEVQKNIPTYLPITKPIYPKKAVGIDKEVNEIMDRLKSTGQTSLALVIYGFGGLGKTTLAEAVVSKIDLENYNYTSLEIYQETEKNDFTRSQQRILKDCFPDYNGGKPIALTDCRDGRGRLMEAFKCQKEKPIFLFIDNVLRPEDLNNLLPDDLSNLPPGSRILITTRNLAATNMFERQLDLEYSSYPLQPLLREDALKILFQGSPEPVTMREEDLNRILKICSGVPLALKIVGAQLLKQRYQIERCSNILENLEKGDTVKEERLSERLVDFVYGELEEYIQEAFLDICCFFSNCNRQDVEYIVGGSAVTSLLEAGLIISTSDSNVSRLWEGLIVHDIIKAKGQGLAKGNRILDVESLREAANKQRLEQIKGIWLVNEKSAYVMEEKYFNDMRKSLRVLALGGVKVNMVSPVKFRKLKFLELHRGVSQLPVMPEYLEELKVFHGPFFSEGEVTLCKLPKNIKAMKVIRQINSSECTNCQMTGAPPCSSLEKLDFSELVEPPKLPKDFNQLVALNILILDSNEKMRELPDQICQLPALKKLSMRMCRSLTCLPESFGQLTTLEYLDLYRCAELQNLCHSFGQLVALKDLNLSCCKKLDALPESFGQLKVLRDLNLSFCMELKALPETFGQLSALRNLNLSFCIELETLPDSFKELKSLKSIQCSTKLKDIVKSEMGSKASSFQISEVNAF